MSDVRAYAESLHSRGVVLVRRVHETPWRTRAFTLRDDQGHMLYFGEPLPDR